MEAAELQLRQRQQQQQQDTSLHEPAEATQLEERAAAARAAAREAAAEARRQRRLEVERQLELAEDLVGFTADERRVDVARGVALLQGMVARWAQCWGVKTGLLFAAVSLLLWPPALQLFCTCGCASRSRTSQPARTACDNSSPPGWRL